MIELWDGIYIAPEHVTLIKPSGENQCVVWTVGQSALDGHVLDYPSEQIAQVVNDCLGIEQEEEDIKDDSVEENGVE
jgi:hypothetical protein